MVQQLRIYTVNRGMMESFIKLFQEQLIPIHQKLGMPVERAWVNDARTEFIWVRSFPSKEAISEMEKAYFDSPERKAIGDLPQQHIAKTEVRLIESVAG